MSARLLRPIASVFIASAAFVSTLFAEPAAAPSGGTTAGGLIGTLEQLKSNAKARREAVESLKREADSLRKQIKETAPPETLEQIKKADELKASISDSVRQLEAARRELSEAQKATAALTEKLEEARKEAVALNARLETLNRTAQILEILKPAGDAKPEVATPAPAAPESKPAPTNVTREQEVYFETKVRPVLAENCFSCHGPEKQKLGLRLDSLEAMLKGGESGSALTPGDPDKSAIIVAIRYDGETKMPPKAKLPQEAIDALTEWVKMGAPWPASPKADDTLAQKPTAAAKPDPKEHWAFKPVGHPEPPEVADAAWNENSVDRFVFKKLEEKKLKPNPEADRRTLLRRATYDLTGLPPTMEEFAAFEADSSPDAYAKVVDRLLASPRYGERWGRYWLDVARYADTKGYVFQEERRYPFSFVYRDWVIRAFNEDLPYDQFLIQQIAADQLDLKDDKRPLAAMGFLTLGRRFLNNKHDIIDDRIDVVSRGTMGLTVACARCHDHKFDPIPTADYYSIYGVFAGSTEPKDLPLIADPDPSDPKYQEYVKVTGEARKRVDDYFNGKHQEFRERYRKQATGYWLAAYEGKKIASEDEFQAMARDRKLQHRTVRRWQSYLDESAKKFDPILAAWNAFNAIPDAEFEAKAAEIAAQIAANAGEQKHHPVISALFAGDPPKTMREVIDRYAGALNHVEKEWAALLGLHNGLAEESGRSDLPPPTQLPNVDHESLRQFLYGDAAPGQIPAGEVEQHMTLEEQAEIRNRRLQVDALEATHPGRPQRAHVLNDFEKQTNPKILKRGNPATPGDEVPRRFFEILSGADRKPFEKGSGRLEFAQAIASKDNPLTARVFVNRVWLHHFGRGIVETPSDFGLRCEPPSHPELLDHLASRFMEEGWSVKKLHRSIMLSKTYRQSSEVAPEIAAVDPENRWLSRFDRRRLDFEGLRDSLLAVADALDLETGGDPVEITEPPYSNRRTVYGMIERQNLPGLFRTFDFASPDVSSPGRFETTVPQQALFLMNSPFAEHAAREGGNAETRKKIAAVYRAIYRREPSDQEAKRGEEFLNSQSAVPAAPASRAWQYGYGEYSPESHTVVAFNPFPHWSGTGWRGGEKVPDPEIGWAFLTAKGGHPGGDIKHCAIRRWIAPRNGQIKIAATLVHPVNEPKQGDGVEGRIIHSRLGETGSWIAEHEIKETNIENLDVQEGDRLDFVVACRTNEGFDSFEWSPRIEYAASSDAANEIGDEPRAWDAAADFMGPGMEPLTPLGQFAQALMLSNEFAFVD